VIIRPVIRCEQHTGDPYPSRCEACDFLAATPTSRIGFLPGTECRLHPGYPLPCDRCERDADGQDSTLTVEGS
jgi:hypothetical protein